MSKLNSKINNILIAFAGAIGSGKSTISSALAEALSLSRVSFGDYIRSVAKQRKLTQDRETLQLIGSELIEKGWEPFCRAVLSQVSWKKGDSIVIDGIRHIEAIEAISRIAAPSRFVLVYIFIAENERQIRLEREGVKNMEKQVKIEGHSTEVQVKLLKNKADIILDGTQPTSEIVKKIIAFFNHDL